jgi:hypothetical protein
MKIPKSKIGSFASELKDYCLYSQDDRMDSYRQYLSYYNTGSGRGAMSIYNRCFVHIDRLSSYLFSPGAINFAMDFDDSTVSDYMEMGVTASRVLSHEFGASNSDMVFSSGVDKALIKGSTFFKSNWGSAGLEATIVQPEMMGVYREDINGLERQEAFVHCMYLTRGQFKRLVSGNPRKAELIAKAEAMLERRKNDEEDATIASIINIGGINPISYTGAPQMQNRGSSNWLGGSGVPIISPQVAVELIPLYELWVQDDDRQDWTTIQFVDEDIVIEGELRHRNLCGVRDEIPFTQICPNYTQGYFWGRSELEQLTKLQNLISKRIDDIDRIFRLRANPPRAIIGSSGLSQEQKTAMGLPGGLFTDAAPNIKIENLAPELPPEAFEQLNQVIQYFDDVAGFKPIMGGEGEPGVRAGTHAETLVRTASPRMRDKAIMIERQCSAAGHYCFKLMQNKDAQVYKTPSKKEFLLSQIPDDFTIQVDSHSTSPAFSNDAIEKATLLLNAGAISNEDFIRIIHPPFEDMLAEKARKADESSAEFKQQILNIVKQDPANNSTLLSKMIK